MWVYKVTNKGNGKVYIGQSIRPIDQRWNKHVNDAINNVLDTHFARAIRKYGKDSFVVEVIDSADTQKELTEKEQYWIRYYNSVNDGYNETDAIYKSGGNTYLTKTEEEMRVIKDKLRNTKLGGRNPNARAVKMINIQTGEELVFPSQKECANFLKLDGHQPISRRCRGIITTPLHGIYLFEYYDE